MILRREKPKQRSMLVDEQTGIISLKTFFLVLIVAAGLRFAGLTFDSLWLDEGYQTVVEAYGNNLPDLFNEKGRSFLYKSTNPASSQSVLANFRKVDPLCPPLYAILINRWLTIFGGSDLALRGFSVLCSLLAITATYFVANKLLGRNCAIYASLLQSISPFDIAYAQEARMYSLCTLAAVLSGGSFIYFIKMVGAARRSNGISGTNVSQVQAGGGNTGAPLSAVPSILASIVYILSTWALINTHYTQLFIWFFAILTGFVLAIVRKDRLLLAWTIAVNICIFLLCIPWLSLFLQAANMHTASFYIIRPPNIFWPLWALLCRIPLNWLIFLIGKKVMLWAIPGYLTSACLIGYVLFVLTKKHQTTRYSSLTEPLNLALNLLLGWAVIPALMIWTLDVVESHRVIEISRYLIGTAPAIYLLGGYAVFLLEKTRYYLFLLIMHASFCLANNAYMHLVPQRENWRFVAQLVERVSDPDEPLLVSHYYNIVCLDRYLSKPMRQVGVSPAFGSQRIKCILQDVLDTDETKRHAFWLLCAQDGDTIFNIIPDRYKIIQSYDFPHALHLRHYQDQ